MQCGRAMKVLILCLACLAPSACQQYQQQYEQPAQYQSQKPRFDAILSHKQALGQDGTFAYQFKADNGLQQGESISPDGSRLGSYSYVDPNGKTISVKYSAGKEGFKILEGDHVPKAPAPLPAPSQQQYQQQPQYQQQQYQQPQQQYQQPQLYHRQHTQAYTKPYSDQGHSSFQQNHDAINAKSNSFTPVYRVREDHNALFTPAKGHDADYRGGNKDDDESDTPVHSGPHTFGNGYSFEFAG